MALCPALFRLWLAGSSYYKEEHLVGLERRTETETEADRQTDRGRHGHRGSGWRERLEEQLLPEQGKGCCHLKMLSGLAWQQLSFT